MASLTPVCSELGQGRSASIDSSPSRGAVDSHHPIEAETAGLRKQRSFVDGVTNRSNPPHQAMVCFSKLALADQFDLTRPPFLVKNGSSGL
jgi:hypothetical protein